MFEFPSVEYQAQRQAYRQTPYLHITHDFTTAPWEFTATTPPPTNKKVEDTFKRYIQQPSYPSTTPQLYLPSSLLPPTLSYINPPPLYPPPSLLTHISPPSNTHTTSLKAPLDNNYHPSLQFKPHHPNTTSQQSSHIQTTKQQTHKEQKKFFFSKRYKSYTHTNQPTNHPKPAYTDRQNTAQGHSHGHETHPIQPSHPTDAIAIQPC